MKKHDNIVDVVSTAKGYITEKVEAIDVETVLRNACKIPGVRINREKYLRKELQNRFSPDIVELAIEKNPAQAGIDREAIEAIAKRSINYETNKVTALSFASGIPGGIAVVATVPADIAQYFAFILRIMQKLAFLYGFGEIEINEDYIDDGTMNQLLVFLGVMFGIQEANIAIKAIAETASKKVVKSLAQKSLTKGTVYPIVKKVATQIGAKMTKQIFADGVGKVIPVIGGLVTGGVTYASFKPCSYRLKATLSTLPISDPSTY